MPENEDVDVETNEDLQGVEGEDIAVDYKAKYLEEISSSKKYRKRAQDAEVRSDELAARLAVAESGASEAEQRLRDALAKSQQKATAFEAAYKAEAVQAPLTAALAGSGITNVDDAAFLLLGRHPHVPAVEMVDGVPVVKVVDRGGDEVIDTRVGEPMSLADLVNEWLHTDTARHYLPASKDTGSGAHSGATGGRAVTIDELDRSPEKMEAFIKEHGQEAYLKLAKRGRHGEG